MWVFIIGMGEARLEPGVHKWADSESGFSECSSNSTIPSPPERNVNDVPIAAAPASSLQDFLQTWTTEDNSTGLPTVTLVVNGKEVKCTAFKIFSDEDAEKLLSVVDGAEIENSFKAAQTDVPMPSMPFIDDDSPPLPDNEEPLQECQNWVQQHHSGDALSSSLNAATEETFYQNLEVQIHINY